jgi:hypothetical protein
MNINALRGLISQPPYDTMSDGDLVVALNSPTERIQGPVTKGRLIMWAGINGGFTAMQQACDFISADQATQLAVRNAGLAASAMFNGGDVSEFDTGAPENFAMLSLFVAVGLLTQAAVDALLELGAKMQTPGEVAGVGGFVNFGDIAEARAG